MCCDSIGSGENYDRASPQVGAAIAAAVVDGEGVLDYFEKHRWMKAVGKRLLSRVCLDVTSRHYDAAFPLLVPLTRSRFIEQEELCVYLVRFCGER